jgi:uncharacterized DUF497 family protein
MWPQEERMPEDIFFIMKKNKKALIVTARDMTDRERKKYAKK